MFLRKKPATLKKCMENSCIKGNAGKNKIRLKSHVDQMLADDFQYVESGRFRSDVNLTVCLNIG